MKKNKNIWFALIITITTMLIVACGDINAGNYRQGDASADELVEITDETDLENTITGDTKDDSSENATTAESNVAEDSSGSKDNTPKNDDGDGSNTDLYDFEDTFYNETGATIVPHGALYPEGFDYSEVPEYSGRKYEIINDGVPYFNEDDFTTEAFEYYSSLDGLGRCGTAYANVCPELMPTEKRGDISEIHPTGWRQNRYDGIVDADPPYLYNRSHLIAYKLAGENANIYNLITGTRYFNAEGMSYVEDRVASYVKDTGNHVLYRVTPVFVDDELLSRGVLMEAQSVEDDKICYCEFVYNVQPGIYIDYTDGYNAVNRNN